MVNLEVVNQPVLLEIVGTPPVQLEVLRQTVELEAVAVQGLAGAKGDKGDKGEPGEVAATLPWSNVTAKPDLVEDGEIIDGGNF